MAHCYDRPLFLFTRTVIYSRFKIKGRNEIVTITDGFVLLLASFSKVNT